MHFLMTAILPPDPEHTIETVPDPLWATLDPNMKIGRASESAQAALEVLMAPFNEQPEEDDPYVTLEEVVDEWEDSEGVKHTERYKRNPKAQWDWWVIGGRFSRGVEDQQNLSIAEYIAELEKDPEKMTYGIVYPTEGEPVWWDRDQQSDRANWLDYKDDLEGFREASAAADVSWRNQYLEKLRSLPKDGRVVFVDCHI